MRPIVSVFALLSAMALPAAAFADTDSSFSIHGNGLSLTFTLPTSPTPDGVDPHQDFFLGDISFVEDGAQMTADDVFFYNKANGGGFDLVDSNGNDIDDLDFFGPKLFTGTVKNPIFKEGKFTLTGGPACGVDDDVSADADSCSYKLKITTVPVSATPEPASLLLLGTGALGAVNFVRRRIAG